MTERDYDDDLTIGIWGTGGLSHSRFGQRLWGNHPGDWLTHWCAAMPLVFPASNHNIYNAMAVSAGRVRQFGLHQ